MAKPAATPTEHIEQVTLINLWDKLFPEVRIFAIPNGGFRHKTTAERMKAEGLRAGVPDLFVPEWRVFIEMKRQKGGRVSDDQADWLGYLAESGYTCIVAKGYEDALNQLEALGYKGVV